MRDRAALIQKLESTREDIAENMAMFEALQREALLVIVDAVIDLATTKDVHNGN
jgi:hypothetical protein